MKIVAFGDTHLSERISLLGSNGRTSSGERQSLADARAYFVWLAECAEGERADVILSAGDLFDRARPTPAEYSVAIDGLRALAAIAPVVIIPGNHDLPSGLDADALRPLRQAAIPGVVFIEELGARVELRSRGGEILALYALPYPQPAASSSGEGREEDNARASRALDAALEDMAQRADVDHENGIASVLLAHVTFSGGRYVADQTAPAYDLLAPIKPLHRFDLVIAGHLHQRQKIGGLYHAFYTGTGDRWGFAQSEEDTGALAVELNTRAPWGSQYKLLFNWLNWPGARIFKTFRAQELKLALPHAGAFVRAIGDVTDPREYDEIMNLLRAWRAKGSHARSDVTLNAQRGALAAVEESASLETLFSAYLLAKPDAIPGDLQAAALARARQIVAEEEG